MEEKLRKKLHRVECLALEGGGGNCLAYLRLLERLEEAGAELRSVAGTSGGALTALLVSLGYDPAEIRRVIEETDFRSFRPTGWRNSWLRMGWRLLRSHGLWDLEAPLDWVDNALKSKGLSPELTFKALRTITGIELLVPVHNLTTGRPVLCGARGTDHFRVRDAVVASMAIPIIFTPHEFKGEKWVDGGVSWNHPVDVYQGRIPARILGCRVDSQKEIEAPEREHPSSLFGFLIRLASDVRRAANQAHVKQWMWPRIVRVNIGSRSALDFSTDQKTMGSLSRATDTALAKWAEGGK